VVMSRREFLKKYQIQNSHYQNKIQRTGRHKCS
jgi:uncharacterized protein YjbK